MKVLKKRNLSYNISIHGQKKLDKGKALRNREKYSRLIEKEMRTEYENCNSASVRSCCSH